tara:strand:+ start:4146 stop:4505 length:360 start_codon:yes stop_codon:yes gene_type:complete
MNTKEYLVEIAIPNIEENIKKFETYKSGAIREENSTNKNKNFIIKKYTFNNSSLVINLQVDFKLKRIPGMILLIADKDHIIINNPYEKKSLEESNTNNNYYPTESGYVMEDYTSSDDED